MITLNSDGIAGMPNPRSHIATSGHPMLPLVWARLHTAAFAIPLLRLKGEQAGAPPSLPLRIHFYLFFTMQNKPSETMEADGA